MSKTVESSDSLSLDQSIVGWGEDYGPEKEVVLVAPTPFIKKLWEKTFPGIKVVIGQKLPSDREQK
jgi:hypothetical protein